MADESGKKGKSGKKATVKLSPAPSAGFQPRITVVAPNQGIRVTFPGPKGGLVVQAFLSEFKKSTSAVPNEAALKCALGKHKYGTLTLPQFEEPAYADFGEAGASGPGSAVVIGNNDYDESKQMGSSAIKNRKITSCKSDADKIAVALKNRKFMVDKSYDQKAADVRKTLNSAKSSLKEGGCFFFCFVGHGTFDGVIGVDGPAVSPADMTAFANAAIEAKSDLVILLDACHQGVVADQIRFMLLDKAIQHCKDDGKTKTFVEAAKNLAFEKEKFIQDSRAILEKQWEIENKDPMDQAAWEKHYPTRIEAWNKFVDNAQQKINLAIQTRNDARPKMSKLTLEKCNKSPSSFNNDDEIKMWAQLDSVDVILNQAVAAKWSKTK